MCLLLLCGFTFSLSACTCVSSGVLCCDGSGRSEIAGAIGCGFASPRCFFFLSARSVLVEHPGREEKHRPLPSRKTPMMMRAGEDAGTHTHRGRERQRQAHGTVPLCVVQNILSSASARRTQKERNRVSVRLQAGWLVWGYVWGVRLSRRGE